MKDRRRNSKSLSRTASPSADFVPRACGTAGHSARRRPVVLRFLPPLFLVAVSCVAYLNADHAEFLFDDRKDVLTDPSYDPSIAAALQRFGREYSTSDAPLAYLTFAVNHAFNRAVGAKGADLTSFLVVNVFIHAVNACLVYFLARALLRPEGSDSPESVWVSLAAATLFAVHPLHASSVAYIIQRRGSLATLFYLLGVLAYLRARAEWVAPRFGDGRADGAIGPLLGRPGNESRRLLKPIGFAAVFLLCFWLSICSKSLGLTLPLMILAVEFCLRAPDRRLLRRYLRWLLPGVVLCVAGVFLFLWRRGLFDVGGLKIKAFGEDADWGPWAHFLTESRVFVHYWKLLLLPLPRWMCIDHGFQLSRSLFEHYAALAIIFHGVLLAIGVWAALRRHTLAAVGVAWFYVALIPYVLLPQAELMVEYKTYLPSVGLALIVAEGLRRLKGRMAMKWQVFAVTAAAAFLLATTLSRNMIYKSPVALWSDAVKKSPGRARPHYNLADALTAENRPAEALVHYVEALRLAPGIPHIANNYGIALLKLGRPEEAARQFEEALRLDAYYTRAYNNLGTALAEMGRLEEAVAKYHEAFRLRPDLTDVRYNLATTLGELGDVLTRQGRGDEALARYREAVEVLPDDARPHFRLGNAFAGKGQFDEAVRCYEAAVRLKPGYAEALTNLGNALAARQQDDQAFLNFQKALKADPGLIAARLGIAGVLDRRGRTDEAVAQYEEILRIDPKHAKARAALESLRAKRAK